MDFTAYHLLRPLALGLRESGWRVAFCCSPGKGLDLLAKEGFETYPIPIARSYDLARHVRSYSAIVSLLKRERFDAVHGHTPVAGFLARAAARTARVPIIAYTAHGFYFHKDTSRPLRGIFVAMEKLAASWSDIVFIQSREDWEEASRLRLAPREKLIHIGNGVDIERFDRKRNAQAAARFREQNKLEGALLVGFVGRLVREKGSMEFVRSAACIKREIPQAKFVMVGAPLPSDRDSCIEDIELLRMQYALERDFLLVGYRTDVEIILAALDVFVLPSYREGMPRSIIEAMAASLPVVATDIRGCREEVVDGVTGILVPPRDHESLARAVVDLLRSEEIRARMGEAGRRLAVEKFNERRVISSQVAALGELAKKKLQK